MSETNPWLKAAKAISDALKQEPPQVQESVKRMNQKIYPETWKAIREKEKEADGGGE